MMTGNEIRKSFIDFFKSKEHIHYESASLVPEDKTLLLTVAGMVPFKPFFLGEKKAPAKRITTYQKCIRTNDLENVGITPRHHTFFEMLGNFSFGDYFKKEAILWSWEYITEHLKLDINRLWVTVYTTDDEAYDIWVNEVGISKDRIVRLGDSDNWWAAGPIGSCGPCSEIYFDTQNMGENNEEINAKPGDEGNRFLEIWNLVFTEWNRLEDGSLVPLPEKNIDTGAGIERIASVMQNKKTNFDTDIFMPIINEIRSVLNLKEGQEDVSTKIIADHIRASVFLICDGVLPSNEGRGYILKKLIRRAYGAGSIANKNIFDKGLSFLYQIVNSVVASMSGAYPELIQKQKFIEETIKLEEEKFAKTLKVGANLLIDKISNAKNKGENKLSSDITFKLYDTFGFPFELTKLVTQKYGIVVEEDEFNEKLEEQINRSKSARNVISDMIKDEFIDTFYKEHGATNFTGYETLNDTAKVLHISKTDDEDVYKLILDKTPFYSAQGGQVSDKGYIFNDNFKADVVDMAKKSDIYIHYIKLLSGSLPNINDEINLSVDKTFRDATMRNHTATHILHRAVKEILGDDVNQAGSLVYDKGLRFDFTYNNALDDETIRKIEKRVNEIIQESIKVEITYTTKEQADKMGAIALFDEKYKSTVRVVDIVGYSAELCGGTHCPHTGHIGSFYILSEQAKASGIRRIEAVTGSCANNHCYDLNDTINEIAKELKTNTNDIKKTIQKNKENQKELEKTVEELKNKLIKYQINDMIDDAVDFNGFKLLIKELNTDSKDVKNIIDKAKDKLGSSVILFATKSNEKLMFTCAVSDDLLVKYKAGEIVKYVANLTGGNGGGKPNFAQAGGKDISKLAFALNSVIEYIKGL